MKKILLSLLAALVFFLPGFAGHENLFSYDQSGPETSLAGLQKAEDFVTAHEGITLSDLQLIHPDWVRGLSGSSGSFIDPGSLSGQRVLRIPSFLWGCFLGPAGVIVVYLVAEDNDETRKSFMGCISWALGLTVYYIVAMSAFY
ncbi:MAG: hypothetical protein JW801_01295 [Bacteroidales bacterium]|nr:hypothetical protein [Bacteroidales bacterium]